MFIIRQMPDPARLRPLPANEAYRRAFYGRFLRESCIVFAKCRRVDMPPFTQRLSIKAARGGREMYFIDHRSVAVDDDNFLILNDGRTYGSAVESRRDIESYSIFFRKGLAEEVLGALVTPADRILDRSDWRASQPVEFVESLQSHDRLVTPVLGFIRRHLESGLEEEGWYDEQLHFLLERMLMHHRHVIGRVRSAAALKSTTRAEIYRRICLATDYIHTHYDEQLDLDVLANAACLSKFHFLRLFTDIHGITPHAYLQRKRAMAAARLLATTRMSAEEVAADVGYSARSSLFRQLRRWHGVSPRALRARRGPHENIDLRLRDAARVHEPVDHGRADTDSKRRTATA